MKLSALRFCLRTSRQSKRLSFFFFFFFYSFITIVSLCCCRERHSLHSCCKHSATTGSHVTTVRIVYTVIARYSSRWKQKERNKTEDDSLCLTFFVNNSRNTYVSFCCLTTATSSALSTVSIPVTMFINSSSSLEFSSILVIISPNVNHIKRMKTKKINKLSLLNMTR